MDSKRVRKQLEVDFCGKPRKSEILHIQVAYDMDTEGKANAGTQFIKEYSDSFKKIIIINGTKKPWRNDEGFVIMGMKYFLLNADSLNFKSKVSYARWSYRPTLPFFLKRTLKGLQ